MKRRHQQWHVEQWNGQAVAPRWKRHNVLIIWLALSMLLKPYSTMMSLSSWQKSILILQPIADVTAFSMRTFAGRKTRVHMRMKADQDDRNDDNGRNPSSVQTEEAGSVKVGMTNHVNSNSNNATTTTADYGTLLHNLRLVPWSIRRDQVDQLSGTDLAYIGDVVFELLVRVQAVWPAKRTSDLQNLVVSRVRAEHQSRLLQKLKQGQPVCNTDKVALSPQKNDTQCANSVEFSLTNLERQVLNRGRNAVSRSRSTRRDPAAYQDSTAFEALIGYLYMTDPNRCAALLQWIHAHLNHMDER